MKDLHNYFKNNQTSCGIITGKTVRYCGKYSDMAVFTLETTDVILRATHLVRLRVPREIKKKIVIIALNHTVMVTKCVSC
jgi:hypothetical protein